MCYNTALERDKTLVCSIRQSIWKAECHPRVSGIGISLLPKGYRQAIFRIALWYEVPTVALLARSKWQMCLPDGSQFNWVAVVNHVSDEFLGLACCDFRFLDYWEISKQTCEWWQTQGTTNAGTVEAGSRV